ncbi:RDD family protein [Caldimonas tepidiphila]|uniref:RDD family protein n=1 Tax=Caldimonas tepidiphila TaxID=2315841 RepID=UPI000E5BB93C|nr:RDD family protein [Caldimonas tepidiphila]
MNAAASSPAAAGIAPPLRHRLASFVYEGVLLFGVVMAAGLPFSMLTGQRHALQGRYALQAFMFAVLAIYFIWFWSHGGQTLAMKTWHLRLLRADGRPVSPLHAACRFLASWVWFLPPLALVWLLDWKGSGTVSAAVFGWMLAYAALSRLHPARQFWHDALCGTRLVAHRTEAAPKKIRA